MSSIVGVSTGCLRDLNMGLIENMDYIKSLGADGVEVYGTELIALKPDELIHAFRQFAYTSVHMPVGEFSYGRDIEWDIVMQKIKDYAKVLGIRTLVFHSVNVADWKIFDKKESASFGIENRGSEGTSTGFRTVNSVKEALETYKTLDFVLDTIHAMSNKIEPSDFLRLKDKICQVHICGTNKMGSTERKLVSDSPPAVVESLKPIIQSGKPLIIELFPNHWSREQLSKEISLIRSIS